VEVLQEVKMTVAKGLVFWYDNAGVEDGNNTHVSVGDREVRSRLITKKRPWVVVASNDKETGGHVCSIVPITASENLDGAERIQYKYKDRTQTVLVEQVQTVDSCVLRQFECVLPKEIMDRIDDALLEHFELKDKNIRGRERQLELELLEARDTIEKLKTELAEYSAVSEGERSEARKVTEVEGSKASGKSVVEKDVKKKEVKIESAVEKFNKRYAQTLGRQTKLELEGTEEKTGLLVGRWDKKKALKFIKEFDEIGEAAIARKYGYATPKSAYQAKRRLIKKFKL